MGIVLVAAMVALGVLRFLKVHDAENQVTALKGQITSAQDPDSQVQQGATGTRNDPRPRRRSAIHIVADEVYWPGVLSALAKATPKGGTINSFSGSTVPRPVPVAGAPATPPLAPSATQIATLAIGLQSPTGYIYFHNWYFSVNGSGKLTVNSFSGISQGKPKQVTFSATVGVTGEVVSIRANEFEVTSS